MTSDARTTLRTTLALALAYALLGGLGLAMAIPPGYASPVFPAAGLAVAAALWSGYRLLPSVWIGSFAMNVAVGLIGGHLSWGSAGVAVGIATGATVQAGLGAWLVRRLPKLDWRSLLTERDSLILLALAGPVACVVSATFGTGSLLAGGVIDRSQALFNGWNWYVGDTIGVLVFAPLTLIWLRRKDGVWRDRMRTVVTPMLLVLLSIGAAFYITARWEDQSRQAIIRTYGDRLALLLESRFAAHQATLSGLARTIEIQPDLSFADFDHLASAALESTPDLSALSFNAVVTADARHAFETRIARVSGRPALRITERNDAGALVPAAPRPSYVVVTYIAPMAGNEAALGFDIQSNPSRADALEAATRTGKMALTPPIRLVQAGQDAGVGLLALTPAYATRGGGPSDTPTGFAVAVIRMAQMVEIATRSAYTPGLAFRLVDADAPESRRLLYASNDRRELATRDTWRRPMDIEAADWILEVTPTLAYQSSHRPWGAWLVGVGGMLLAALLQTLLFGITGRTALVRNVVREQTEEIGRKNEALAQSEELLRNAIEAIGEAFVIYDPDDRLIYCNDRYRDTYRESAQMIEPGRHFEEIIRYGAERGQYTDAIGRVDEWVAERIAIHRSADSDQLQRLSDGRWLRIRERKTSSGHIVGFRVDVTELYEAKEAAERANTAKSQFLATMSHELRTPMNGVLGMAQLLMLPELTESERMEYAQTILDSGNTLLTLLNDILDLSKIEAGRLALRPELFAAEPLIRQSMTLYAPSAEQKGLRLVHHWHGPKQATYEGDAMRIRQMLSNLISNAIKFTDRGEITVSGEERARPDGLATLRFSVRDTGSGIALDDQHRLFQPFTQVDSSNTRRHGGTGLGLSIVRRLAHLMGGDAGVESIEGAGSTFWFTVQVRVSAAQLATDVPATPTAQDEAPSGGTILVVEDNRVNQQVVAAMLARLGYTASLCNNGREAVDRLTEGRIAPEMILMDCQMPVMDGYAAARHIREWERTTGHDRHPIIALTASAFAEDRARCEAAGMDDHLAKPLHVEALEAVLRRWVAPAPASDVPNPSVANDAPMSLDMANSLIDQDSLRRRYADDDELIGFALDSYVADWAELLESIVDSAAADDAQTLFRQAHALKSVAASISGDAVTQAARQVEMAAREGQLDGMEAQVVSLQAQAATLADAARCLRSSFGGG